MTVTVSKWGNSSGIRIPTIVLNSLNIKIGDELSFEIENERVIFTKEKTTRQLFEEFYGKPYDTITAEDIGDARELDWGEDVGGEIIE